MGEYADMAIEEDPFDADLSSGYWKTRDGRVLLISEMGDAHLENAINFMDRKGAGAQLRMQGMLVETGTGEVREAAAFAPIDPIDRAENAMTDPISGLGLRVFKNLLAERERRKTVRAAPDEEDCDSHT